MAQRQCGKCFCSGHRIALRCNGESRRSEPKRRLRGTEQEPEYRLQSETDVQQFADPIEIEFFPDGHSYRAPFRIDSDQIHNLAIRTGNRPARHGAEAEPTTEQRKRARAQTVLGVVV